MRYEIHMDKGIAVEQVGSRLYATPVGYPPGHTVHGVQADNDYERLSLIARDLRKVLRWCYDLPGAPGHLCEPVSDAALTLYCVCFDKNSGGKREERLRAAEVFDNDKDLAAHKELVFLRNKYVAHDDNLHPMRMPLIVLDPSAFAVDVHCQLGDLPIHSFKQFHELRRLAEIAEAWVVNVRDKAGAEILEVINASDLKERTLLKAHNPYFTEIKMVP